MTESEAARHDLYNALVELLGETKAGTLMTHLPTYDPVSVATAADLADLGSRLTARFEALDARLDRIEGRFDQVDARIDGRFDRLDSRVDRVFLTLAAGLLAIVATLATALVAGLT